MDAVDVWFEHLQTLRVAIDAKLDLESGTNIDNMLPSFTTSFAQ